MLKKGFTLIELLVVIAIIAILAAIIFPVFSRVKDSAYRSSDLSNMNALRTALQLYRQDQGGYPPQLLGYVNTYSGMTTPESPSDVIPANTLVGALYPKRVDALNTFQPAYDRINAGQLYTMTTEAVWPNNVNGSSASNPGSYQRYGPQSTYGDGTSFVQRCYNPGGGATPTDVDNYYYSISGYDVATVPWEPETGKTGSRQEIHYAPFWSAYTVAAEPCSPIAGQETGSSQDDPRQLGYYDPPESTVVTWDSNFRDMENGDVQHTKKDIVLFLGGSARPYDSAYMAVESWKATP
jgi:prepilin-type N-terminal cleavage/methylation domain-containing protein